MRTFVESESIGTPKGTAGPKGRAEPPSKPSPSTRLLDTASTLFAEHGIRAVGIDRILAEAGVARASLYSSYGSKDALVLAYLEDLDQRDRQRWHAAAEPLDDPIAKILTFFDLAMQSAPKKNFRGCQYANAATEFPQEPLEPVLAHREWLSSTLVDLLNLAGATESEVVAGRVQLIYDGALSGSKFEHSVEPIRLGRDMAAAIIETHLPR
ncbi:MULTISPECIES: TetR/AcrR family transcriptional regulator [Rhodococcus]|uniref:TetR/AcrR family transcriptional regulator n=1 Tax=Rhodococcus TaxID=1827 RepID=UPI001E49B9F3|nr:MULTISPECIES: TetR/AcrR family transcriptional regulator [Rhodococcus]MCD5421929.1 TetR/AcrR family transcriptional regulator [Rhodococcus pyridinivorans]BDB62474.1 putative transcriptional regulator, TetR family protein [Rhodococcus sp. RDE2]